MTIRVKGRKPWSANGEIPKHDDFSSNRCLQHSVNLLERLGYGGVLENTRKTAPRHVPIFHRKEYKMDLTELLKKLEEIRKELERIAKELDRLTKK